MKRHLSHVCRLFAFFLVFLMVLAPMMTPATAVAETETSASERETGSASGSSSGLLPDDLPEWETEPNPDYEPGGEAFRAMEIPTRRERYVKHFALGGGEYQAVVYGDAVHRLNADGTWRDIDNRLLSDGAGRFATPDGRVQVAGNTGRSDFLLSIEENGYYIAMTPYDSGAVTAVPGLAGELLDSAAEIVNHPERVTADTDDLDALMTVNNTTCVTYSSVYRATNLEYILTGDTIKENIIVNAPADSYTYVFRIRLSGLYPVLSETGEIRLLDEGTDEERYVMPAPFMYDADGDYSDEVSYRILETEEAGQYLLAVVADENWFSERDRAFPVTIDPSLQSSVYGDTYIDKTYPTTNYDSATRLWVSPGAIVYLRMTTPYLPTGSTVLNVNLNVYCYYVSYVTSKELTIGAYQVNDPWSTTTITWNSAQQNTNFGISDSMLSSCILRGDGGYYESSPRRCSFDITDALKSWIGGTPNYGIALKYEGGTNTSACVRSRESGTDYGAYYVISYRQPVLENGVYRLNNAASNKSLDVKDGGYTDGTALQIWTTYTSLNRNQLYKITYAGAIGEDNLYTIRPMVNNALGLYCGNTASDMSVKLKTMPSTTAQGVFSSGQKNYLWILSKGTDYYTIKSATTSVANNYMRTSTDPSNGSAVYAGAVSSTAARWIPEAYTEELNGFDWRAGTTRLLIDETFTFHGTMYHSDAGRNGPITYSVTDENKNSTDCAEINATTGKLTANKGGQVRVVARYPGAKWIYIYHLTIYFEDGIIHTVRNVKTDKLIIPSATTSGASIKVNSFDNSKNMMMWKFISQGNGYYQIKNELTGYYLTAPVSNVTNAQITQSTLSGNYSLWRIRITDDGYFTIQSKNQELRDTANPLYLAVSGEKLVQSGDSTSNKWDIRALVMRLQVRYDQAFVDRFGNNQYMNILKAIYSDSSYGYSIVNVFKNRFGIAVRITFNSTVYETNPYVNDCAQKNNFDEYCLDCKSRGSGNDALDCENGFHHKRTTAMLDAISPRNDLSKSNYTNVVYTGHKCCTSEIVRDSTGNIVSSKHCAGGLNGFSYRSSNVTLVFASVYNDELLNERYDNIMRTTTHELLHTFGIPDENHGDQCILSNQSPNTSGKLLMCDKCLQLVKEHRLWLYQHS